MRTSQLLLDTIRSKRKVIALGVSAVIVNRLTQLVLPYSTKILVDKIIIGHQFQLTKVVVCALVAAAAAHSITSFVLTSVIGSSTEHLIADLRKRLKTHVARLPVSFCDSTKAGTLVSRIMNDVESMHHVVGAGLIELAGAIVTALTAMVILWRINHIMTVPVIVTIICTALAVKTAMRAIQPIHWERSELYAEVVGRLTESLNGMRIVKCFCAEGREDEVFAKGVTAVLQRTLRVLRYNSFMNVSTTFLLGLEGALIVLMGVHEIARGRITVGGLLTYLLFLGFLNAPVVHIVFFSMELGEVVAGLRRSAALLGERRESDDPRRKLTVDNVVGHVRFEDVSFGYEPDRQVLHDVSFDASPGALTALVGPAGAGKSTML